MDPVKETPENSLFNTNSALLLAKGNSIQRYGPPFTGPEM